MSMKAKYHIWDFRHGKADERSRPARRFLAVSDGIEETGRAKDEATEILELQSRSNRTVMETQKNIRTSIKGR